MSILSLSGSKPRVGWALLGLALLVSVALLSGCAATEVAVPTSSPLVGPDVSESPLEPTQEPVEGISDARRSTSAKQAFPVAWEAARSWREDARWYGIVPYTSIERAFAIPLQDNNPSWFFRFAVPGDDLEYLVEVNNGVIVGTNETRLPTYIEPALSDLDPLNESWEVNDNGVLLEQYAEQEGNLLADFPNMVFAYRLTKPKDDGFAIWALYNAQNIAEPIFRMNALTGEALPASE